MPSVTFSVPDLSGSGAIAEVTVIPSHSLVQSLQRAGQPLPPPIKVSAQVDTGVSGTVCQPWVFKQLGLNPVGNTRMALPGSNGTIGVNIYCVDILFANSVTVTNVFAAEAPMQNQNVSALIGRDVLRRGVLIYLGGSNQFTLSF
jgi:hypothetical protein